MTIRLDKGLGIRLAGSLGGFAVVCWVLALMAAWLAIPASILTVGALGALALWLTSPRELRCDDRGLVLDYPGRPERVPWEDIGRVGGSDEALYVVIRGRQSWFFLDRAASGRAVALIRDARDRARALPVEAPPEALHDLTQRRGARSSAAREGRRS